MGRDGTQPTRLNRWVEQFSGVFDIPPEVALDVPKTTWIGRLQLQIENHKGIVEYTSRKVRVRTGIGQLVITGSRLKIGSIFGGEIVVDGQIMGVELLES